MNKNEMNSSETGTILHELQTAFCLEEDRCIPVTHEDESIATSLIQLNKAAKWIENSPSNPFKTKPNGFLPRIVEVSPKLNLLLSVVRIYGDVIAYRASKYSLNPKVSYMLDKLAFIMEDGMNRNVGRHPVGKDAEDFVRRMNEAAAEIKSYFASRECKRKMLDFTKGAKDNFRSLIAYFKALFLRKSRYLVIRLDLEYRSSSQVLTDTAVSVSYEEARRHREMFFEKVLRHHKEIDGYVWKMEHGLNRGYHYHAVFFIDSRNNPQDITIARILGGVWEEDITHGLGFAYNCNADKSKYKCCGIGMIDHHDADAMEGLVKIAMYLTKQDEFMKLKLGGRERVLGKGVMKKLKYKNAGRPRVNFSAELKLVNLKNDEIKNGVGIYSKVRNINKFIYFRGENGEQVYDREQYGCLK